MQIGQAQIARIPWYDRNTSIISDSFTAIQPPHASTVRVSYTVPANKSLLLTSLSSDMFRYFAATAVGVGYTSFLIYDDSPAVIYSQRKYCYFANIGDSVDVFFNPNTHIQAGYKIEISSTELSTGGIVIFSVGFVGNLYDA